MKTNQKPATPEPANKKCHQCQLPTGRDRYCDDRCKAIYLCCDS